MTSALEAGQADHERDLDERALHKRVQWFVEKWTTAMDLNKRHAAELNADLVIVVQSVHRDASRETHALLTKVLMAMPPQPIFVPTVTQEK